MKKIIFTFLLLIFICNFAYSQVPSLQDLDANSLGMGGVFVTLNSNGETYFFNPATLALKRFSQLSLTTEYPFSNNPSYKISYIYPSTSYFAITVDIIYEKDSNIYSFSNWKAALAFPLSSKIFLGTGFQYIEDNKKILRGNIGILLNLWENIKVGIVGYGIIISKYSENEILVTLPQGYAVGLSLKPLSGTNLFVDLIDIQNYGKENSLNYLRFGLEQWIGDFLALRWGSMGDITNPLNYTIGLGLRINILQVDFATLLAPIINSSEEQKYKITGNIRF
jgi:hypothetical protein